MCILGSLISCYLQDIPKHIDLNWSFRSLDSTSVHTFEPLVWSNLIVARMVEVILVHIVHDLGLSLVSGDSLTSGRYSPSPCTRVEYPIHLQRSFYHLALSLATPSTYLRNIGWIASNSRSNGGGGLLRPCQPACLPCLAGNMCRSSQSIRVATRYTFVPGQGSASGGRVRSSRSYPILFLVLSDSRTSPSH